MCKRDSKHNRDFMIKDSLMYTQKFVLMSRIAVSGYKLLEWVQVDYNLISVNTSNCINPYG